MEIATLESILACYNPICNADSMHVVPKREPSSPTAPFTCGKTVQIHDSPIATESRIQPHYLNLRVSLLAQPVHFRTMGMNQINNAYACIIKACNHHFTDHDININHIMSIHQCISFKSK